MKKTKLFILPLLCVLVGTLSSCGPEESSIVREVTYFKNPVFGCGADPTIIRAEDGYFYSYVTSGSYDWEGNEQYFKATGPILKSRDLVNFEYAGSVFPDGKPTWSRADNADVWAPEVVYRNGKYYYYYTLGVFTGDIKASGIGVAVGDTPVGPFVDKGKILDSYDVGNPNAIDPFLMEEDGKIYLFYGSFGGIDYIELDETGTKPKYKDQEFYGAKTMFRCGLEGGYIFKKDGYYHFMGSGGTMNQGLNSSYYVTCYRSTSLFGEYTDAYLNNAKQAAGFNKSFVITPDKGHAKGTGHNAVIQDDAGDYWIIYHAYDELNWRYNQNRELLIDKLRWGEDGMPYVQSKIGKNEYKYTSSLGSTTEAPYVE